MSADQLKRAATKLREHAERLPEPWATRPWRTVATDTETIDGIAACVNDHADDPHGAFDCCWSPEPVGHEAVASFIILMHPPVALALADLLELMAQQRDYHLGASKVATDREAELMVPGWHKAITLAREILREAPDA